MNNTNVHPHSSSSFFEKKYRQQADPWNFSGDPYEQLRYNAIVSALSHRRYKSAFEPGCSIGVLTERLADFCDAVEAIDFSQTAVSQANTRCEHLKQVAIHCASLDQGSMKPAHDLLVLCEIGYYFCTESWKVLSTRLIATMHEGGTVLAAHWVGTSSDHTISGDEVHEVLLANQQLQLQHSERHPSFRLDLLVRR